MSSSSPQPLPLDAATARHTDSLNPGPSHTGPSHTGTSRQGPARKLAAVAEQWAAVADSDLLSRYLILRQKTEALVSTLGAEDMVVQSMPDASPAKWHLAHTTWFFETFLLSAHVPGYQVFDASYAYLFNSYYNAVGPRHPRPQRGLLTRPTVDNVMAYRRHVDSHMHAWLQSGVPAQLNALIRLGLAHEEQHQELLLMDMLHLFAESPVKPVYDEHWPIDAGGRRGNFVRLEGGLIRTGFDGQTFAFDNEGPRHTAWLEPFDISDRLVTNGQWLEFMADGGYKRAEFWLSDGWTLSQAESWQAPLYWEHTDVGWKQMALRGLRALDLAAPVTHISYYEADAFAHWAGARLPTEVEWEHAARRDTLEQVDTVAWQWTGSAYTAYPGFRPVADAVGEYNGKFMSGQMVLRGGASVTPTGHSRLSYRNFYRPEQRWMFSGVRLARDIDAVDKLRDMEPGFANDVAAGLSARPKTLSPKYFYDAVGSDLFEAICLTPEYYPTRTETALLANIASELAADIPAGAVLVEFGSGASDKTRLVLDAAPQIAAYVPVDISADALDKAVARLAAIYPQLPVLPVADDFTRTMTLPAIAQGKAKVGFFPGSTIGNFDRDQAVVFLSSVRQLLGENARLVIGADIVKDEATLVAAYDDAEGVTAQFNKNILVRINHELGGDFDLDAFEHLALWNEQHERMEMHLVSGRKQTVQAAGQSFAFNAGETIHTESSHKFTPESFRAMAEEAGWSIHHQWISPAPHFAIFSLKA